MYTPKKFIPGDEEIRSLLENLGAVDLVSTTAGGIVATHLPLVFDSTIGEHGALLGHVARANDHWRTATLGEALVIVHGPETYVSPSWYATKYEHGRVVPTWNYTSAHVYGELLVHDDSVWVEGLVRRLTTKYESTKESPWSVDDAPTDYVEGQLRAIVGVEVRVSRIEATAKWSQNRSDADRQGVIVGLENENKHVEAGAMRYELGD
jgi:transcriptional regulator